MLKPVSSRALSWSISLIVDRNFAKFCANLGRVYFAAAIPTMIIGEPQRISVRKLIKEWRDKMRITGIITSLAALFLSSELEARQSAEQSEVTVTDGRIAGTRSGAVDAFLGVPYAAPPIGPLRWRAPQKVQPWSSTFPASKFGPNCPQAIVPSLGPWTHEYLPSGAVSEDCLTLNVWRPVNRPGPLPVLVWIHGGGFTSGSSSVDVYDGSSLASQGILVVSISYRLGFFGFLASPEFRDAGGGNFGLMDQIAALRWVKANIHAFGGDPSRVTIAGQSAGAFSVHYLMLAPGARGLFKQAIPQSGTGLGTGLDMALTERNLAEKGATQFIAEAGAASVDEARKLSFKELAIAYMKVGGRPGTTEGLRMGPYADGSVLPLDPKAAFVAGKYHDTPIMIGLTADEGSGLNFHYRLTDTAKYQAWLRAKYGVRAAGLERIYPPAEGAQPVPELLRDGGVAATLNWSQVRNRTSRKPLFGYVWTHVEPGPEATRYGAFHTSEVPYVFGTLDKAPERKFGPSDYRISEIMQNYWVNFIKRGNPNGKGLPKWPAFGKRPVLMELGSNFGPYPPVDARALDIFNDQLETKGALLVM